MMHAVLADTGPLYAAVDPRDEFHKQAVAEMRKLAHDGRRGVGAYPILLEAHAMVRRRLGRGAASDWLADMAGTALIKPTPENYRQANPGVGPGADQTVTLFDATVA